MQPHLRHQLLHPAPDLDQTEAQGVQLHTTGAPLDQFPPQGIHQPVGSSVQEQLELVGTKRW
jgi:hypothetical protein